MAKRAPLRLLVCGASGRTGSQVARLAADDPRFEYLAGFSREGGGELHPSKDLPEFLPSADVVVDFTRPAASLRHARAAAAARVPIVIGTTGWTAAQRRGLQALSKRTAVLAAPNLSPAVQVLFHLAKEARRLLPDFDVAVVEAHHTGKKDAPSGTALRLCEAAGGAPALSVRAGGIVGDHTLYLAGAFERLELTHRCQSREAFARGALEAALLMRGRRSGLHDFADLLGIR